MKNILLKIVLATGLVPFALSVVPAGAEMCAVECSARFDSENLVLSTYLGWDTVEIEGLGARNELGRPHLPSRTVYVILDGDDSVTEVEAAAAGAPVFVGSGLLVMPTQEAVSRNRRSIPEDPLVYDAETYSSHEFYPASQAELKGHADLAGNRFAALEVTPFQYVPATGELFFTPEIRIALETEPVAETGLIREPAPRLSDRSRRMYRGFLEQRTLNPEAITFSRAGASPSPLLPAGKVDEVIITKESWVDDFQPIADWRTRTGTAATIITKEWITSNYSGSNTEAKIRNFVIDAYGEWGTVYILLGGDSGTIGSPSKRIGGINIYSDYYYSDFDEDWVAEVAVGRASVDNESQIDLFVNKVLFYEQTPEVGGGYPANAFFFAFDLDGQTFAEISKTGIENSYVPDHMRPVATEYDSEPGSHKNDSINYLNQGYNLVNHDDHANATSLGVGSVNHWSYLYNSDMRNLSNAGKLSIFYSLGCHSNDFKKSEGIGEEFMRNDGGGGVAYIGNTHNGIYIPGSYNTLSFMYDKAFFKSLFTDNMFHLGMTLLDSKNDHYPGSDTYKQVWYEICALGDPGMPIWTDIPMDADVSAPQQINPGSHDMLVTVGRDGEPSEGATVLVSDGADLYETAVTGEYGTAVVDFEAAGPGTVDFTVAAHDCNLYETSIQVVEGPGLSLTITPGATVLYTGETLVVDIEVTNGSGGGLNFNYRADLTSLPSGEPYFGNPLVSTGSMWVEAGGTASGSTFHPIPAMAPEGIYRYTCLIGDLPGAVWDEFTFEFEVIRR